MCGPWQMHYLPCEMSSVLRETAAPELELMRIKQPATVGKYINED